MIIVVVPTPIDQAHKPDLSPLMGACETVGEFMTPGATIVFESTVYPGCTEEVCVPILERRSGMSWSGREAGGGEQVFHVGYSPERINPGDKQHRLETIVKVVSGDSPETLDRVSELYESVVNAGVHRAASIKVAEAAKVIENTQRDLNIALMNELALIFNRMDIEFLLGIGRKIQVIHFFYASSSKEFLIQGPLGQGNFKKQFIFLIRISHGGSSQVSGICQRAG